MVGLFFLKQMWYELLTPFLFLFLAFSHQIFFLFNLIILFCVLLGFVGDNLF
jgi:hypothetical protein